MYLINREQAKGSVYVMADLARQRRQRGLRLNYPEAMAFLTSEILEAARSGQTMPEIMSYGKHILSKEDVMDGIPEIIHELQVEAIFPDGIKLITVPNPIQ